MHKKSLRPQGTSTTLNKATEEGLADWVNELRSEGIPVSNLLMQSRALEVARDLGFGPNDFKASDAWIQGFMKRWRFAMRSKSRAGQADLAQGEAKLAEFSARIREVVASKGVETIFNADQTGINYEYIPKKTINTQGAKTVWIKGSGHEKDRLTAMVLADSNGVKYPLFLVLKTGESKIAKVVQENLAQRNGFGRTLWPEIEELQERHPSRIFGNPTAWWNSKISLQFLTYHFGHRRGTSSKPVLLLWDDFSAHFTDEVKTLAGELNVILERIPPSFTWICQPADVAWMKPIKSALRRRWVEYLRTEVQRHHEGKFKLTPPDRYDLVEWVNTAWEGLSTATIVNGFLKCGIIERSCHVVENCVPTDLNDADAFDMSALLENLQSCESLQLEELSGDLDDDFSSETQFAIGAEE
jgi:hypothetical protein